MTKWLTLAFAVALLLGSAAHGDAPKDDLAKMQGEWKVEKAQRGGESPDAKELAKMLVRIKGTKISIDDGSARDETGQFTLDAAKKPAAIDIKPVGEDVTLKGIYQIDGDTLTICWDKEGDRPTMFVSKPNTKQNLFILKRKK
jgi:uncharacterized protein (TIGR03067 family)